MTRLKKALASALIASALITVPAVNASAEPTPRHTVTFSEQRPCLDAQANYRALGYVIFKKCQQVWIQPGVEYYYQLVKSIRPV